MIISRLPQGGGGKPGIKDGKGLVNLNIFTQQNEPKVKDGIWVKTGNKYQKVITDNRILSSGGVWSNPVSDLPYTVYYTSAVVYNGEIHILGGFDNTTCHYKWNGSSWTRVSTLPYSLYYGSAVVFNNEIHILGSASGSYMKYHYKYNGSSWTYVSNLPYEFYAGSAVVYNNEIHILGSKRSGCEKYHYKWNGSSWVNTGAISYFFYDGSAVVYNGEIHILSSYYGGGYFKNHYKWTGSSWVSVSTLPYDAPGNSSVVYNGEIHIMSSSSNTTYEKYHYKWNGSSWTNVSIMPIRSYLNRALVYGTSIWVFETNATRRATFTLPANTYDPYTLIIQRGNTNNGIYVTAFADMSAITGSNNRFQTGFDDAWYFGSSAFEITPIYYGDGTKWIKFKN